MRNIRLAVLGLAATLALGACSSSGSDGDGSQPSGRTSASAPEDRTTSATAVAAGLAALKTLADKISDATAKSAAAGKAAAEALEGLWEPIEGTVKAHSADTYLAIEDAFANLESGVKEKAASGAADLKAAVDEYLSDNPS
jgi:hypothetical protein